MLNTWLIEDHRIHLPKLLEKLGYQLSNRESNFLIYNNKNQNLVIIQIENGYVCYKVPRPEHKFTASELIIEHVSKIEGPRKETIWDKVNAFYQKVLENKDLLIDTHHSELDKVSENFNHFKSYTLPFTNSKDNFYDDVSGMAPFQNRILESKRGNPLFPLFNLQNENCGFFVDEENWVFPYKESAIENSLWYSNIPENIDWLIVFKDPREALAFHKKFALKNVVYLALGKINSQTSKILFQIKQASKTKKIILSFTGNKKIKGYLRDLNFISQMNDYNFRLTVKEQDIIVRFPMGDEKSFLKFFNSTKTFNQGVAKGYLKYNKILNQNRINEQSFMVAKKDGNVQVRIPLEVNAIKFFVWSYYKNYLSKTIDILKPVQTNWYLEWEATQSMTLKGKEEQLKDYRIAL